MPPNDHRSPKKTGILWGTVAAIVAVVCAIVFISREKGNRQPAGTAAETEKPAPSGIDALELVKVVHVPHRLRFVAYDLHADEEKPSAITAAITTVDRGGRTSFVNVGDEIPGTDFKIESFKQIEVQGADRAKTDVSELTVINRKTGGKVVIPLKQIVDSPETYATFRYKGRRPAAQSAPDFSKRAGDTFTLPPEEGKNCKVIEVKEREAVIELPDGTRKTLTVPHAP